MFAELVELITAEFVIQTKILLGRFDKLDASQAEQTEILKQILAAVTLPPAVSGKLRFVFDNGQTAEGDGFKMAVPMNTHGIATVTYKSASGGVGKTDGPPVWSAAPEGMVTLNPSTNGLSCDITTLPVTEEQGVNSVIITVEADGDLGPGVSHVTNTGMLDIFNPASGAVVGDITFGEFIPT